MNKITEEYLLRTVAGKNNVSVGEVRKNLSYIIDDLWLHEENDTEEFKKLRSVIGHKPSIMEFVTYCTERIRKTS